MPVRVVCHGGLSVCLFGLAIVHVRGLVSGRRGKSLVVYLDIGVGFHGTFIAAVSVLHFNLDGERIVADGESTVRVG